MSALKEQVKGFEGLYYVTSCGRVLSCGGKSNHKGEIELRYVYDRDGYKRVCLQNNKKRKSYRVCRLVAEAFIPNPQRKPVVNHINEVKDDDRAENLEWATVYENWLHSNLDKETAVLKIDKRTGEVISEYRSLMKAARDCGINQGNITNCLKGRCKSVGGFKWKKK